MWFFIALLGYLLLAIVMILDKVIVSESRVSPIVYTFYSTIIVLPILVAAPFLGRLSVVEWGWATFSGIAFGFALFATFLALEQDEASHVGPFSGALITTSIAMLSFLFLNEVLSRGQTIGVLVLVISSLLLSYEKTKNGRVFHVGFLWATLAAFLFAVSHVSAKYLYDLHPFALVLFATKGTAGLVGLVCLFSSRVRKVLQGSSPSRQKGLKRRHPLSLVAIDKILGIVGVVLIQYAIATGSVTLVNALAGLQYIFLFFLVVVCTRFFPSIFQEYITKKEYRIQTIAVVLAAIGSFFVVL